MDGFRSVAALQMEVLFQSAAGLQTEVLFRSAAVWEAGKLEAAAGSPVAEAVGADKQAVGTNECLPILL
jgi:hypothetical protein